MVASNANASWPLTVAQIRLANCSPTTSIADHIFLRFHSHVHQSYCLDDEKQKNYIRYETKRWFFLFEGLDFILKHDFSPEFVYKFWLLSLLSIPTAYVCAKNVSFVSPICSKKTNYGIFKQFLNMRCMYLMKYKSIEYIYHNIFFFMVTYTLFWK